MSKYIYYDSDSNTVTIFPDVKTNLHCFRLEESGYDWYLHSTNNLGSSTLTRTTVIIKNVIIETELDVRCINWFIAAQFNVIVDETVDISKSSVDAIIKFICENLIIFEIYRSSLRLNLPYKLENTVQALLKSYDILRKHY
jgi:hypothetical protein